jgi:hypothetical protein
MAERGWKTGWLETASWARPISQVLAQEGLAARSELLDHPELTEEQAADLVTKHEARRLAAEARRKALATSAAQIRLERIAAREAAQAELDKRELAIQQAAAAQIQAEREEARKRRQETREATELEREKAQAQAVEARAQEAQLVRLARGAVIGTLGGTMRLMPALAKLAEQLRAAVDANQIPVEKAASTINQISRTVKDATVAAQVVVELERLHVGAPQAIIGVVQHEIALDEAVSAVEEAEAAVQRAKELGLVNELGIRTERAQA